MEITFKSDRYFIIFDNIPSHGQFLLRSQKTEEQLNNIDIIFFDTTYIQIFRGLYGIRITQIENKNYVNYVDVRKYLEYENNNLFEIESNNEKFYIAASFIKIFENQLEFHQSSLRTSDKGIEIM